MPPDGMKHKAEPAQIYEVPQRYPIVGSLQFDLTDPDGKAAFDQACNARMYLAALWDTANFLRDAVKYGDHELDAEAMQKKFLTILDECKIRLE